MARWKNPNQMTKKELLELLHIADNRIEELTCVLELVTSRCDELEKEISDGKSSDLQ